MLGMALKLRDYQKAAVENILEALDRRPILVAPTGSGKTVMGTRLITGPTIWIAHRYELIEQAARELRTLGLSVGIIKSGHEYTPGSDVQVASVQTLVRRDNIPADLIIIDECHHATAKSYRKIIDKYSCPVVGLTATPFRLDGTGLGEIFGEIIVAAYTDELCDRGLLHKPRVFASRSPDLRGVKTQMGDYAIKELSKKTNTDEMNADIVKTWLEKTPGTRTICFAVDIEHSKAIVAAFQAAGVAAEHLDGKSTDRIQVLSRLRRGVTKIVSNVYVLTEGWDLPALETAIIARPTASLNLHLQTVGRIMRATDGKTGAVVLDHAGNHHVHGMVTRRLEYSLTKKTGVNDPLGLRRCKVCQLLFEPGVASCPDCGWTPEMVAISTRERPVINGDGELVQFDDTTFEYRKEIFNLIEAQREAAGYKPGWTAFRFKERFGYWPVTMDRELINTAKASMDEKRHIYQKLIDKAKVKGFNLGWAAHQYRKLFGVWPRTGIQISPPKTARLMDGVLYREQHPEETDAARARIRRFMGGK